MLIFVFWPQLTGFVVLEQGDLPSDLPDILKKIGTGDSGTDTDTVQGDVLLPEDFGKISERMKEMAKEAEEAKKQLELAAQKAKQVLEKAAETSATAATLEDVKQQLATFRTELGKAMDATSGDISTIVQQAQAEAGKAVTLTDAKTAIDGHALDARQQLDDALAQGRNAVYSARNGHKSSIDSLVNGIMVGLATAAQKAKTGASSDVQKAVDDIVAQTKVALDFSAQGAKTSLDTGAAQADKSLTAMSTGMAASLDTIAKDIKKSLGDSAQDIVSQLDAAGNNAKKELLAATDDAKKQMQSSLEDVVAMFEEAQAQIAPQLAQDTNSFLSQVRAVVVSGKSQVAGDEKAKAFLDKLQTATDQAQQKIDAAKTEGAVVFVRRTQDALAQFIATIDAAKKDTDLTGFAENVKAAVQQLSNSLDDARRQLEEQQAKQAAQVTGQVRKSLLSSAENLITQLLAAAAKVKISLVSSGEQVKRSLTYAATQATESIDSFSATARGSSVTFAYKSREQLEAQGVAAKKQLEIIGGNAKSALQAYIDQAKKSQPLPDSFGQDAGKEIDTVLEKVSGETPLLQEPSCKEGEVSCLDENTMIACHGGLQKFPCPKNMKCVSDKEDTSCRSGELCTKPKCEGNTPFLCKDGSYVPQPACKDSELCNSGVCECKVGERYCSDNVLVTCEPSLRKIVLTGLPKPGVLPGDKKSLFCSHGCYGAAPKSSCRQCEDGKGKCEQNKLYKCVNGRYELADTCNHEKLCDAENVVCKQGDCIAGMKKCDGRKLVTCVLGGVWNEGVECDHGCYTHLGKQDSVGCGECSPGACSKGNARCVNGQWEEIYCPAVWAYGHPRFYLDNCVCKEFPIGPGCYKLMGGMVYSGALVQEKEYRRFPCGGLTCQEWTGKYYYFWGGISSCPGCSVTFGPYGASPNCKTCDYSSPYSRSGCMGKALASCSSITGEWESVPCPGNRVCDKGNCVCPEGTEYPPGIRSERCVKWMTCPAPFSGETWEGGPPCECEAGSESTYGVPGVKFNPACLCTKPGFLDRDGSGCSCLGDETVVNRKPACICREYDDLGTCACPEGAQEVDGQCICPTGHVLRLVEQKMPDGSTRTDVQCQCTVPGKCKDEKRYKCAGDWDFDGYATKECHQNPNCIDKCPDSVKAKEYDCNDKDATVNPGEDDICGNKIDDNCDGFIDDESKGTIEIGGKSQDFKGTCAQPVCLADMDNDGYLTGACLKSEQCVKECARQARSKQADCADDPKNPNAARIHPGADELCDNNIDDDCDGKIDKDDDCVLGCKWDWDGDGYPSSFCSDLRTCQTECPKMKYVLTDCVDDPAVKDAAAINPGAREKCENNLDDNCDGRVDEKECDASAEQLMREFEALLSAYAAKCSDILPLKAALKKADEAMTGDTRTRIDYMYASAKYNDAVFGLKQMKSKMDGIFARLPSSVKGEALAKMKTADFSACSPAQQVNPVDYYNEKKKDDDVQDIIKKSFDEKKPEIVTEELEKQKKQLTAYEEFLRARREQLKLRGEYLGADEVQRLELIKNRVAELKKAELASLPPEVVAKQLKDLDGRREKLNDALVLGKKSGFDVESLTNELDILRKVKTTYDLKREKSALCKGIHCNEVAESIINKKNELAETDAILEMVRQQRQGLISPEEAEALGKVEQDLHAKRKSLVDDLYKENMRSKSAQVTGDAAADSELKDLLVEEGLRARKLEREQKRNYLHDFFADEESRKSIGDYVTKGDFFTKGAELFGHFTYRAEYAEDTLGQAIQDENLYYGAKKIAQTLGFTSDDIRRGVTREEVMNKCRDRPEQCGQMAVILAKVKSVFDPAQLPYSDNYYEQETLEKTVAHSLANPANIGAVLLGGAVAHGVKELGVAAVGRLTGGLLEFAAEQQGIRLIAQYASNPGVQSAVMTTVKGVSGVIIEGATFDVAMAAMESRKPTLESIEHSILFMGGAKAAGGINPFFKNPGPQSKDWVMEIGVSAKSLIAGGLAADTLTQAPSVVIAMLQQYAVTGEVKVPSGMTVESIANNLMQRIGEGLLTAGVYHYAGQIPNPLTKFIAERSAELGDKLDYPDLVNWQKRRSRLLSEKDLKADDIRLLELDRELPEIMRKRADQSAKASIIDEQAFRDIDVHLKMVESSLKVESLKRELAEKQEALKKATTPGEKESAQKSMVDKLKELNSGLQELTLRMGENNKAGLDAAKRANPDVLDYKDIIDQQTKLQQTGFRDIALDLSLLEKPVKPIDVIRTERQRLLNNMDQIDATRRLAERTKQLELDRIIDQQKMLQAFLDAQVYTKSEEVAGIQQELNLLKKKTVEIEVKYAPNKEHLDKQQKVNELEVSATSIRERIASGETAKAGEKPLDEQLRDVDREVNARKSDLLDFEFERGFISEAQYKEANAKLGKETKIDVSAEMKAKVSDAVRQAAAAPALSRLAAGKNLEAVVESLLPKLQNSPDVLKDPAAHKSLFDMEIRNELASNELKDGLAAMAGLDAIAMVIGSGAKPKEYRFGKSDRDTNIFIDKTTFTPERKRALRDLLEHVKKYNSNVDVIVLSHEVLKRPRFEVKMEDIIAGAGSIYPFGSDILYRDFMKNHVLLSGQEHIAKVLRPGEKSLEDKIRTIGVPKTESYEAVVMQTKTAFDKFSHNDVQGGAKALLRAVLGRLSAESGFTEAYAKIEAGVPDAESIPRLARELGIFTPEELGLIDKLAQLRAGESVEFNPQETVSFAERLQRDLRKDYYESYLPKTADKDVRGESVGILEHELRNALDALGQQWSPVDEKTYVDYASKNMKYALPTTPLDMFYHTIGLQKAGNSIDFFKNIISENKILAGKKGVGVEFSRGDILERTQGEGRMGPSITLGFGPELSMGYGGRAPDVINEQKIGEASPGRNQFNYFATGLNDLVLKDKLRTVVVDDVNAIPELRKILDENGFKHVSVEFVDDYGRRMIDPAIEQHHFKADAGQVIRDFRGSAEDVYRLSRLLAALTNEVVTGKQLEGAVLDTMFRNEKGEFVRISEVRKHLDSSDTFASLLVAKGVDAAALATFVENAINARGETQQRIDQRIADSGFTGFDFSRQIAEVAVPKSSVDAVRVLSEAAGRLDIAATGCAACPIAVVHAKAAKADMATAQKALERGDNVAVVQALESAQAKLKDAKAAWGMLSDAEKVQQLNKNLHSGISSMEQQTEKVKDFVVKQLSPEALLRASPEARLEQWGDTGELVLRYASAERTWSDSGLQVRPLDSDRTVVREGATVTVYKPGDTVKLSRTITTIDKETAKRIIERGEVTSLDYLASGELEKYRQQLVDNYRPEGVGRILTDTWESGSPGLPTAYSTVYQHPHSKSLTDLTLVYELEIPVEKIVRARGETEDGAVLPSKFNDLARKDIFEFGFVEPRGYETEISFLGWIPKEYIKDIKVRPLQDGTPVDVGATFRTSVETGSLVQIVAAEFRSMSSKDTAKLTELGQAYTEKATALRQQLTDTKDNVAAAKAVNGLNGLREGLVNNLRGKTVELEARLVLEKTLRPGEEIIASNVERKLKQKKAEGGRLLKEEVDFVVGRKEDNKVVITRLVQVKAEPTKLTESKKNAAEQLQNAKKLFEEFMKPGREGIRQIEYETEGKNYAFELASDMTLTALSKPGVEISFEKISTDLKNKGIEYSEIPGSLGELDMKVRDAVRRFDPVNVESIVEKPDFKSAQEEALNKPLEEAVC
ncbi:hypothetical protein HY639_03850 [Candidatus Woesearchaeota archaeon]|nr:hypothetical protein [Candidatus Woesearchaeota archaeon]